MTKENSYNMPPKGLFGKRCRIKHCSNLERGQDELISRQAVNILVDELARAISDERCCMPRGRSTGAIMKDILDLPPVNPQETVTDFADRCRECGARYGRLLNQKWIPVSERLPEEKQSVLVWCPEYKNMYCAYLENKNWWIFGAFSQVIPNAVIAWMPLPEPYKVEPKEREK